MNNDLKRYGTVSTFFHILDRWGRESSTEVGNSSVKGDGEMKGAIPSPEPSRRGPAPLKSGVGAGSKLLDAARRHRKGVRRGA
jgi:hypothetical protein